MPLAIKIRETELFSVSSTEYNEIKAHFNGENFVFTSFLQRCTDVTYIWRHDINIQRNSVLYFLATVRFESERLGLRRNQVQII